MANGLANGEGGVDYLELTTQLELQEVESPGGVATPQLYGQLLALYLLHNDLPNAKFLWKRIPPALKTSTPELTQVWVVGQKMWQREFPAIYEALNKEWPEHLKPIMDAVLESMRARGVQVVGQAYSSIAADQLATILGLPVNEAVDVVVAKGWEADAQTRMITPKKPERPTEPLILSEQQMSRLTDFVSFLEN